MQPEVTMASLAQSFRSGFRTDLDHHKQSRWIGLENEYLMVSSDGKPIQPKVLHKIWQTLIDMGWTAECDDIMHNIIAVNRPRHDLDTIKTHNFDVITTDFGYPTLEIDLAPAQSIPEGEKHLRELLELITSLLATYNVCLLGYGVQPLVVPSRDYLGSKSRYELLFDTRVDENEQNQNEYTCDINCISASCQTQVEVSCEEAIGVLNALNATSGLRIALLANSSVWQNRLSNYKAIRHLFWDWCWPSRSQQFGLPPRFQNIEHYLDYLFDFGAIQVKREGKFYRINHNKAFRNFFFNDDGEIGIALDGSRKRLFASVDEDIKIQSGFSWFDCRLQPSYGTIEDRVSCQQPPQAPFSAAALTMGLVENAGELISLSEELSLDQWRNIRLRACHYGLAFSYPGVDLHNVLERMLHIAQKGLKTREFAEEKYLVPLYERLIQRKSPADEAEQLFLKGGIKALIEHYDMRNYLR